MPSKPTEAVLDVNVIIASVLPIKWHVQSGRELSRRETAARSKQHQRLNSRLTHCPPLRLSPPREFP